jgi:hypothetical protein
MSYEKPKTRRVMVPVDLPEGFAVFAVTITGSDIPGDYHAVRPAAPIEEAIAVGRPPERHLPKFRTFHLPGDLHKLEAVEDCYEIAPYSFGDSILVLRRV